MLITSILFAFLCHCGGSSATSTVSPMMLPSDYNHSRFFKRHTSACSNTVTIKKGDICFDLAKQNGISVDQIKSLNPGVDCDILQIGSKFCVAGNVAEGGKGGGEGSSTPNSSSNPSSTTTGTFIAPPEPTSINSTTEVQNLDFALGQDAQRFCAQFPTLKQGDGNQNKEGQCSFTVQGAVPSFDQMTSTLIIHPDNGATVDNSKNVTVEIAIE